MDSPAAENKWFDGLAKHFRCCDCRDCMLSGVVSGYVIYRDGKWLRNPEYDSDNSELCGFDIDDIGILRQVAIETTKNPPGIKINWTTSAIEKNEEKEP